jgi:transcriptional regulator with PAS, ATPase and Fis domain
MVNEGCERNYDLSSSQMIGRPVGFFEAKGFIKPVIATRVIATKERVTALQRTHKGKTILATGIPLFDEEGNVRRVIINSRDMTELMRLQAELADTQDHLQRAQSEVANLRQNQLRLDGIVLQSDVMQRTARLALRVAKSDATVLLTGESGVGKEVVARLIHKESSRASGPFIKINCGAIPRDLLESELFGYEGGAFTGALKKGKPGLIELADGGTLFFDEIGELPLDMQVKILHVLQDRTIVHVGGTDAVTVDIRIIAATNRELEQLVQARAFRSDLFYRLNVVPIEIPPLRKRREDILALLQQYLAEFNTRYATNRRLSPKAVGDLIDYDWPGNVRELRNMVERLVVTAIDDTIDRDDLPAHLSVRMALPETTGLKDQLLAYEAMLVCHAIKEFGNTRAAARHLGISQSSMVRKLKAAQPAATQ